MQTRHSTDELDGMLEFPGGKVELGESLEAAAIREVLEETGVHLEKEEIFYYKCHHNNKIKDKVIELNIFLFNDCENKFLDTGWYPLDQKEDLIKLKRRIPPANEIFLKEFLNSNKFKMLLSI